jgi:hypothetical protein
MLSADTVEGDGEGTCEPEKILTNIPDDQVSELGFLCTARCPLPIYEDWYGYFIPKTRSSCTDIKY